MCSRRCNLKLGGVSGLLCVVWRTCHELQYFKNSSETMPSVSGHESQAVLRELKRGVPIFWPQAITAASPIPREDGFTADGVSCVFSAPMACVASLLWELGGRTDADPPPHDFTHIGGARYAALVQLPAMSLLTMSQRSRASDPWG